MPQSQEKVHSEALDENALEDLLSKVKAVAQGPQRELFAKIVDTFFEEIEEEYFSPEDLADIQEGLEEIKRGEYLTLEEYRDGKRL